MEETPSTGRVVEATVGGPTPLEIGFARPITWVPARVPHPFFLTDQSSRTSWVDLGWLVLFLLLFEVFLVVMVRTALGGTVGPDFDSENPLVGNLRRRILPAAIAIRAGLAMLAIAMLCRRRGQSARSIGVERTHVLVNAAFGVLTVLAVYGVIFGTLFPLVSLWPGLGRQMQENASRLQDLLPPLGPLGFIPVAILIGLYEEVIFRGFMLSRLRRGTGSWTVAVVASTAVFTLLHSFEQTTAALIVVGILSIVFSMVTIWRQSIIPAIVAHTLFDYSQFVFLYFQAGDSWR